MQRVRDAFALVKADIFPRTLWDSVAPRRSLRSPVPHLFQSNAAPTHAEEFLIREAIMSGSDALALLEKQLPPHGEKRRKKQHARRAALAEFVQRHEQLLSPLRRLPPEILVEIFKYLTFPTKYHSNSKVPWMLCRVSRSWQAATLSDPLLWTEVYIDIARIRKDRHAESYLLHLNLLLKRSREALLRVHIDATRSPDFQNHPLVDALVHHCTRWREVSIKCTPPSLAAFRGIKGRLPNLRILSLDLQPYQEEGSIDLFEVAPKLSEVRLDGLVSPCDIHLPWSQLTSMWDKVGARLGIQHVCVLASNQITDIHYGTLGRVNDPTSVPTATLEKLHTLALDLKHSEHLHDFDNLTLPAVTTIQIAGYIGRLLPKLQAMVSRSSTPSVLRKLAFRTTHLEPGDLGSILEYTPQLEELDTPLPSLDDLSQLTRRQGPDPLVPNLQILKIFANRTDFARYTNIINLLAASRCDLQPILQPQLDVNRPREQLSQPLNFQIVFSPDPEICTQRIEELETNRSPNILHEGVKSEIQLLANWYDQLVEHVPSLAHYEPVREKELSPKSSRHMERLFSQIEGYPLVHVESLHRSKLHLSIQRLSKLRATKTAGDKIYPLSQRADQIVGGWEPILRADLPNRRWAHLGVNSITYVPISSSLRPSPDAMTIIYGHDSKQLSLREEIAAFNFNPRDRLGQVEGLWTLGG